MAELTLFLLFLCSIGTSIISAVTGMGGGIVLLSLMSFVLPMSVVIPIHGLVQLVSNSYRCYILRNSVKKDFLLPFLIGLPLGVIPSAIVIQKVENRDLFLFLIASLIIYVVFKPKKLPPLLIPSKGFFFVGIIAGFLGLLVGAVGPFLAPFFVRDDLKKTEIVATKSSLQIFTHLSKIPAFLSLGFPYENHFISIGLLSLGALVGTKVGVSLLDKIHDRIFIKIFKTVLFFAAIRLYLKVMGVA